MMNSLHGSIDVENEEDFEDEYYSYSEYISSDDDNQITVSKRGDAELMEDEAYQIHRQQLTIYYQKHNPENVHRVNEILFGYIHGPGVEALFRDLMKKYGEHTRNDFVNVTDDYDDGSYYSSYSSDDFEEESVSISVSRAKSEGDISTDQMLKELASRGGIRPQSRRYTDRNLEENVNSAGKKNNLMENIQNFDEKLEEEYSRTLSHDNVMHTTRKPLATISEGRPVLMWSPRRVTVSNQKLIEEDRAATLIQTTIRRRKKDVDTEQKKEENSAAVTIQKQIRRRKVLRKRKQENQSAVRIQAYCRGALGRRIAQRHQRIQKENAEQQSALCIQAHCRGSIGRRKAKYHRVRRKKKLEEESAIRIQTRCRGTQVRRKARRHQMVRRKKKEKQSIICIQANFRGSLGRQKARRHKVVQRRNKEEQSALRIQANCRRSFGRRKALRYRLLQTKKMRERNALRIQSQCRGALARRKFKRNKEESNISKQHKEDVVQNQSLNTTRNNYEKYNRVTERNLENEGAYKIQKFYRKQRVNRKNRGLKKIKTDATCIVEQELNDCSTNNSFSDISKIEIEKDNSDTFFDDKKDTSSVLFQKTDDSVSSRSAILIQSQVDNDIRWKTVQSSSCTQQKSSSSRTVSSCSNSEEHKTVGTNHKTSEEENILAEQSVYRESRQRQSLEHFKVELCIKKQNDTQTPHKHGILRDSGKCIPLQDAAKHCKVRSHKKKLIQHADTPNTLHWMKSSRNKVTQCRRKKARFNGTETGDNNSDSISVKSSGKNSHEISATKKQSQCSAYSQATHKIQNITVPKPGLVEKADYNTIIQNQHRKKVSVHLEQRKYNVDQKRFKDLSPAQVQTYQLTRCVDLFVSDIVVEQENQRHSKNKYIEEKKILQKILCFSMATCNTCNTSNRYVRVNSIAAESAVSNLQNFILDIFRAEEIKARAIRALRQIVHACGSRNRTWRRMEKRNKDNKEKFLSELFDIRNLIQKRRNRKIAKERKLVSLARQKCEARFKDAERKRLREAQELKLVIHDTILSRMCGNEFHRNKEFMVNQKRFPSKRRNNNALTNTKSRPSTSVRQKIHESENIKYLRPTTAPAASSRKNFVKKNNEHLVKIKNYDNAKKIPTPIERRTISKKIFRPKSNRRATKKRIVNYNGRTIPLSKNLDNQQRVNTSSNTVYNLPSLPRQQSKLGGDRHTPSYFNPMSTRETKTSQKYNTMRVNVDYYDSIRVDDLVTINALNEQRSQRRTAQSARKDILWEMKTVSYVDGPETEI